MAPVSPPISAARFGTRPSPIFSDSVPAVGVSGDDDGAVTIPDVLEFALVVPGIEAEDGLGMVVVEVRNMVEVIVLVKCVVTSLVDISDLLCKDVEADAIGGDGSSVDEWLVEVLVEKSVDQALSAVDVIRVAAALDAIATVVS